MATDLEQSSAGRRIHVDEDCYDVIYWLIKFGVSIEQLLEAAAKVGPLVIDVERQLRASQAVTPDPSAANPPRAAPGHMPRYSSIAANESTMRLVPWTAA